MTSWRANIDGDILAHELGQNLIAHKPITIAEARANCDKKIQHIKDQAGCDAVSIFLTDGPSNFRLKLATIKPYKGNRDDTSKPAYWAAIRDHLVEEYYAEVVYGFEADDQLAMEQSDDTVLCSRDKDLDQVPGWHYSWECGRQREKKLYHVDEITGKRYFYLQLIMGDRGDNIPGLYRVGKETAKKKLATCQTEPQMYKLAQKMYEHRFGSYWEMFLTENARLLYLLRDAEDTWKIPTC